MILKKYINIKSIFIIIFKIKLLFVVGIGDVDIGVVDCVVVVCSLLDPVVVDSKVVEDGCMIHPSIVMVILVGNESFFSLRISISISDTGSFGVALYSIIGFEPS